ncbi:hypothetical protein OG884_06160 [Streptosporangium sp. NBC_01755]|uniref:hypothetical protein n=1 Tax=Streptosporangium sp. NBC_01755 TaxID=2975949 RepID=UPI002DDB5314|nr:hypothetical protein [Streptosporangium sp. NBC_01755]WSD01511.1 hypothetical protein OG884_06160 [Streptosporangium sp. NBC_01755]
MNSSRPQKYGEYDGDVEFAWQPQDITVDDSPEELYATVNGDEMTTEYTIAPITIHIDGGAE